MTPKDLSKGVTVCLRVVWLPALVFGYLLRLYLCLVFSLESTPKYGVAVTDTRYVIHRCTLGSVGSNVTLVYRP